MNSSVESDCQGKKAKAMGSGEWKSGPSSVFCCIQCSWCALEARRVLLKKKKFRRKETHSCISEASSFF